MSSAWYFASVVACIYRRPAFIQEINLISALRWKISTVLNLGYLMKVDLCILISRINDQVRYCFLSC